jgi:two-component system, chemotaxis family, CheB/CheR fusion protein
MPQKRKPAKTPASRPPRRPERQLFAVPPPTDLDDSAQFSIVGVGASAGGLEAFSAVLQSLPKNPGSAIVFVQHLAPQHESALVPLLSGQSTLPVVQATDGLEIEPNHVYVIPPNAQMIIMENTLHVNARPVDKSQYTPIDAFFSSLAEAAGPRAIGVVLSGTASDGALGIRDIKAAGGLTIAQRPDSAKYEGMPRAAVATGMIDLILPPKEIGPKLAELARHAYGKVSDQSTTDFPVTEAELSEVFDMLKPVSGVDFRHYKLPTIKRRLFRRLAIHRLTEIGQYIRLLRGNPSEVRSLYQDLLIHVTRFFREPESFEALDREVFPLIVHGRTAEQPIRVWVSGCATGEEAYSLAISLVEYLQKHQVDIPVQIFATDVSETAIEQARTGMFPPSIEADVGPDRLRRFFSKHDGGYRVTKMIRDLCVFARQDLTKDPPFSRLDLILCRNVLIYMDTVLQKKLLSIFHYALNQNGFLMLGHAETVGAQVELFSLVDKKYRVHRKKAATAPPTMTFPADYSVGLATKKPQAKAAAVEKFLQTEVSRVIMDRFAPPGVVVDTDMQIVQFRGQTGAFLEPAPGEASLNLLKMAKEGLLYGLRTALHTAHKTRNAVHKDGLQIRSGDGWKPASLDVIPLSGTGRMYYLVMFGDVTRASTRKKPDEPRLPRKLAKRERKSHTDFLQRELAASREYLQSIIQELEAANEELQSANEEILSSNEELQSTNEELDTAKEELQSTNEELNTVNEELHGRNEELSRVNSDLINLLGSVQIAIVIVSADLRIRRFTPTAEKVLNLIPADADRRIGHINPNIVGANLEELIAECIDAIAPIEREVQDRQGHWYSLRIRPYRTVENKIDGAVVTLYDIDAPKRYEEMIRAAVGLANDVIQMSAAAIAIIDSQMQIRSASPRFAQLLSMADHEKNRRRPLSDFVRADEGYEQLRAILTSATPAEGVALDIAPSDGRPRLTVDVRPFPAYDSPSSRIVLLVGREAGATRER